MRQEAGAAQEAAWSLLPDDNHGSIYHCDTHNPESDDDIGPHNDCADANRGPLDDRRAYDHHGAYDDFRPAADVSTNNYGGADNYHYHYQPAHDDDHDDNHDDDHHHYHHAASDHHNHAAKRASVGGGS